MLLGLVLALSMLPAALDPALKKNRHPLGPVLQILSFSPPAAAASGMVRSGLAALSGFAILACWLAGLVWALVALERRPPRKAVVQTTTLSFEGTWERLGAIFGPRYGPLVAQWLRFYSRNNRFRTIYPLAIPLVVFLAFTQARVAGPKSQFASLLGCFALVGCIGTAQFAVNQFGYMGGGLRRYFLLPADPAMILRSGSYAFVSLGALLILPGTIVLLFFSPVPLDAMKVAMLLGTAVTALFLMHGLGLWSTLFGPRRGNFYASFGNDLSLIGNIAVIGGMMSFLFLPRVLAKVWPAAVAPQNWWVATISALLAAGFYFISLGKAGAVFRARREKILAVIEGRN